MQEQMIRDCRSISGETQNAIWEHDLNKSSSFGLHESVNHFQTVAGISRGAGGSGARSPFAQGFLDHVDSSSGKGCWLPLPTNQVIRKTLRSGSCSAGQSQAHILCCSGKLGSRTERSPWFALPSTSPAWHLGSPSPRLCCPMCVEILSLLDLSFSSKSLPSLFFQWLNYIFDFSELRQW